MYILLIWKKHEISSYKKYFGMNVFYAIHIEIYAG